MGRRQLPTRRRGTTKARTTPTSSTRGGTRRSRSRGSRGAAATSTSGGDDVAVSSTTKKDIKSKEEDEKGNDHEEEQESMEVHHDGSGGGKATSEHDNRGKRVLPRRSVRGSNVNYAEDGRKLRGSSSNVHSSSVRRGIKTEDEGVVVVVESSSKGKEEEVESEKNKEEIEESAGSKNVEVEREEGSDDDDVEKEKEKEEIDEEPRIDEMTGKEGHEENDKEENSMESEDDDDRSHHDKRKWDETFSERNEEQRLYAWIAPTENNHDNLPTNADFIVRIVFEGNEEGEKEEQASSSSESSLMPLSRIGKKATMTTTASMDQSTQHSTATGAESKVARRGGTGGSSVGRVLPLRRSKAVDSPAMKGAAAGLSSPSSGATAEMPTKRVLRHATPANEDATSAPPLGGRGGRRRGARGGRTATLASTTASTSTAPIPSRRGGARRRQRLPVTTTTSEDDISKNIGDDGNLFYCHICREMGEVVCCDGCPNVFHPTCVPVGPSRTSLDNDDDPWYCPQCIRKDKEDALFLPAAVTSCTTALLTPRDETNEEPQGPPEEEEEEEPPQPPDEKSMPPPTTTTPCIRSTPYPKRRSRAKRKCADCQKPGGKMIPCKKCHVFLHYPCCAAVKTEEDPSIPPEQQPDVSEEEDLDGEEMDSYASLLCTSCRAEMVVDVEEEEYQHVRSKKRGGRRKLSLQENSDMQSSSHAIPNAAAAVHTVQTRAQHLAQEQIVDQDRGAGVEDDIEEAEDESEENDHSVSVADDNYSEEKLDTDHDDTTITTTPTTTHKRHHRKKRMRKEKKKKRKRRKLLPKDDASVGLSDSKQQQPRKKQRRLPTTIDNHSHAELSPVSPKHHPPDSPTATAPPTTPLSTSVKRPVKATPPFFFFLAENRLKIEKVLQKKNRNFKRLTKGLERNECIAKEGRLWWNKIHKEERYKWNEISMKDFEERVIRWKEESLLSATAARAEAKEEDEEVEVDEEKEPLLDDDDDDYHKKDDQYKDHVSPYVLTSTPNTNAILPAEAAFTKNKSTILDCVEKPSSTGCNATLLELLQDIRFHPLPMVDADRTRQDFDFPDFSKMTVPYFDVHGPIATTVGDECLGCTRGWCHYCPVLKRQFPAVEHRAKLQPPLSSHMATRIGMGLKWMYGGGGTSGGSDEEEMGQETTQALPLSQPSCRVDDIVQFVEEAMAMKIPHSIVDDSKRGRPLKGPKGKSKKNSQRQAPGVVVAGGDDGLGIRDGGTAYECRRCHATIQTSLGCVNCRRSMLVVDVAKRQPSVAHHHGPCPNPNSAAFGRGGGDNSNTTNATNNANAVNGADGGTGFLKLQTVMLGRAPLKATSFEKQREGDRAVAAALSGENWRPSVVMPCHKTSTATAASSDWKSTNDGNNTTTNGKQSRYMRRGSDTSPPPKTLQRKYRSSKNTRSRSPSPEGRQAIAAARQDESNTIHKKCLGIATCGVLFGLMRRDPLRLFAEPVPASVVGYRAVVDKPMDFRTIRRKVLLLEYTSLGAFAGDVRVLCKNAMAFNPPGSIYWDTAEDLLDALEIMQKRASDWMAAIKSAHNALLSKRNDTNDAKARPTPDIDHDNFHNNQDQDDPFTILRSSWPGAVEIFQDGEWLQSQIKADFIRTKENEAAYYGYLSLRRATTAAAASLAYPGCPPIYKPSVLRNSREDELLRQTIDSEVSALCDPTRFLDRPGWREESLLQLLRRVQSRKVEGRIASLSGCARCDGTPIEEESKLVMIAEQRIRERRTDDHPFLSRIAPSRIPLTTGLASTAQVVDDEEDADHPAEKSTSVRGSRIHGWGLFADRSFPAQRVVAEYVGEYVSNSVADAREKIYQEKRIQDYQFRVDRDLVIDATLKGNESRYINHCCTPNCIAKIIPGKPPHRHLKRVVIVSQRNIEASEEITYDYQFPVELDLDQRIACNCGSENCRGFLNWDSPEKGSNRCATRTILVDGNDDTVLHAGVGRLRHHRKISFKQKSR